MEISNEREYIGERMKREVKINEMIENEKGKIIEVKMNIIKRKKIGGMNKNIK